MSLGRTAVLHLQQQRAHLGRVRQRLGPAAHAIRQEDGRRVGRGGDGGARLLPGVRVRVRVRVEG